MTRINRDYIVDYIDKLIPDREDKFKIMEDYAKRNNIPIIGNQVAEFIKVLLKIHRPKNILEIGTAIGYSSLIMADALEGDCKITSIERREDMYSLAKTNIKETIYRDRIKLILGDAKDELERLEDRYDLIFIDAAKGQYLNFFNQSIAYLNPNGLILSDNVLFKGMVADDKLVRPRKGTIVKRLRGYLEYIHGIDGYTTSLIPIGDGIALTYKEE